MSTAPNFPQLVRDIVLGPDPSLAPYLAAERTAETVRLSVAPNGVCWSGLTPDAPTPRTDAEILAASMARKARRDAFKASPRGHLIAALVQLQQLGCERAAQVEGIYRRSLADERQPLDVAAVGSALLILNPLKGPDAEAARDALAELLMADVRKAA